MGTFGMDDLDDGCCHGDKLLPSNEGCQLTEGEVVARPEQVTAGLTECPEVVEHNDDDL